MGTLSSRVRLIAIALLGLGALGALGGILAPAAAAQSSCGDDGCVDVVAVDGLIDSIEADLIIRSVRRANAAGDVVAVVLQMKSRGSAVSDERLNEVARVIKNSKVPVSVWVGASGANAYGGAAELVQVANSSGITPGSSIGHVDSQRLDPAEFGNLFEGKKAIAIDRKLEGESAVKAGLVERFDPTLVDHVGNLDAVDTRIVKVDGKNQKQPVQRVRLSKLPLPVQLLHTAASPSVAYLLIVIGAALLLFEFFTAGVGVAGVVGAGFVLLGGFGLAELPFTGWALGLLIASFVAFAIDMQNGLARLWTIIGMVAFTIASVFLVVEFRPTILALIAGILGIAAVVFRGMPSMIRARFGTPLIGREWLIDEVGNLTSDLSPTGTVNLRGVDWKARGVDDAGLSAGAQVRVVGTDGLILEVEPA